MSAPWDLRLTIRTHAHELFVVRSVVGGIAANEELALDETADLRMVADELAATLILLASPGGLLQCRFALAGDGTLSIAAHVPVTPGTSVDTGAFAWHVLDSLSDSARTWVSENPDDQATHLLHIAVATDLTHTADGAASRTATATRGQ